MIVEREEEIEAFVPREYWTLEAHLGAEQPFTARLTHYQGEKLEQFTVNNERDAFAIQAALRVQAAGRLIVDKIDKRQRRRNPAPPFTTSTLQQDASRRLGFTAQRTMRVAQQLYEGVEGTEGLGGLITYMRTDSVTLAQDAIAEIREFIGKRYGNDNVPESPRVFRTRTKNAQDAHEAIRPTSAEATPESLKGRLNGDQMKLYELIWRRTVACQMEAALIDTVAVDFACGEGNVFRANGSTVVSPGFLAVYEESADTKKDDDKRLPALDQGQSVPMNDLVADQHFTEPPPRYNEASLVRSLEEHGIGRPSTYAAIISTLQQREYVELVKRRFHPTDVGRVVSRFLTGHFSRYVDYDFTARLEDDLDAISRGEKAWVPVMEAFWHDFHDQVVEKDKSVKRSDVTQEPIDENCPDCGGQLAIRLGRRGRFIGCTKYPDCSYTRSLDGDGDEAAQPETIEGRTCPSCESALVIRDGKYGKFIGCSSYPECTYLEPIEKPKDTEVGCPKCEQGTLLQRRSRRGKQFFSCSTFPKCDYAVWNESLAESCPSCEWPVLTLKTTKRRGAEKVCPQKECGYVAPVDEGDADGDSSGEVAFSEAG
jgi:DNA topoisomerase-1